MTQPNTIATRFAEKFNKDAVKLRAVGQQTGYVFDDDVTESLLAFFQAELLAIAEEVEKNQGPVGEDWHEGFNNAMRQVATLIRTKAQGLGITD